jgi:hypothetical protein
MSNIHLLGNGDSAHTFNKINRSAKDKLLICNMPPFAVDNVFASVMVDFKMMSALADGFVNLDAYDWILGTRPKKWMEMRSDFYMKYAPNIKAFHTQVPKYAGNATNFNCGHMAAHYACSQLGCTTLNMYGFDSIFDYNLRSSSDLFLESDRGEMNNYRLINIWRPVWMGIFQDFPDTRFVLHHTHEKSKIKLPNNVSIVVVK